MTLKKILFVLIILILSISAVSADDSFSDLQNLVDNSTDTLELSDDYTFQSDDSNEGIEISHSNVTINGNNHILDGQGSARIFNIMDSNVCLENINFINGNYENGGAIYVENSYILIRNCTFSNNNATSGGAIYMYDSNAQINNSIFVENSANTGAAIFFDYITDYDILILNSVFNDNAADEYFAVDENGRVLLISNDGMADHQMNLYVPRDARAPGITFLNVSYNEFKNQSFRFEEDDLNRNMDNKTVRFELFKDDVLLINTTNLTKNGVARIDWGNLSIDDYFLKVYYKNLTDSFTIKVRRDVNFTMSIDDIFICEDAVVNFNISRDIEDYENASGLAVCWINPHNPELDDIPEYYADFNFKDNNITIPFADDSYSIMTPGSYIVFLYFYGDGKYYYKIINQTFNVYPLDYNMTGNKTILTVEDMEKFAETRRLYFNLTDINGNPLKDKELSIKINGVTYTRTTDENGRSSIAINLNTGNYLAVISFMGDDQYLPSIGTAYFSIPQTVDCDDEMLKYCRDSQAFYAQFTDYDGNSLTGGKATFNINGVFYERDIDENGNSHLNINLAQGNYTVTATNPVTGHMKSCLIKILPTITDNYDLVKYYRNDSQYIVKLQTDYFDYVRYTYGDNPTYVPVQREDLDNKVIFNINGVFYERYSDECGYVKMNINLKPGKYIITAEYNGCRVSNNITVLSVLNTSDLKMSYKDGSTFNAKLVDGQGNPLSGATVTFNINGVFYQRVTGDGGIAKLNINLMAGEYIITSSYNGSNIANTIKVVV